MRCLFILALVLLTACGGGDPPQGPSEQPQNLHTTAPAMVVAAYGDSTQQGSVFVSSAVGYVASPNAPPSEAQMHLRAWSGKPVIVVNEGRGGTNSLQLLNGTDVSGGLPSHLPWYQEMARSPAHVVSINHSINDRARPLADFKATMKTLTLIAQNYGKVVVLETANPIVHGTTFSDTFNLADHAARAQAVREVADETGAILCDQYAYIMDNGYATLAYLPDGIHPSNALYAIKGWRLGYSLVYLSIRI